MNVASVMRALARQDTIWSKFECFLLEVPCYFIGILTSYETEQWPALKNADLTCHGLNPISLHNNVQQYKYTNV